MTQPYEPFSFNKLAIPSIGSNMDFNTIGVTQPWAGNVPGKLTMPGAGSGFFSPGGVGGSGFGANLGTFNAGIKGLETIGGLWAASKQLKAMKTQQRYQERAATANSINQVKSYNRELETLARGRSSAERTGDSPEAIAAQNAAAAAYVDKNRLVPTTYGKG